MTAITPVTSELYWLCAAVLTIVDLSAVLCLMRCIPAVRFRHAALPVTGTAILFWSGLWTALMVDDFIWQYCYRFVFVQQARWLMPVLMGLLFGAVGYGIWWLALRLPWHPIIAFTVLGGLASLPGNAYAIYARGILDTPLLEGVSAFSALVFGIFGDILYWILILTVAFFARSILDWWTHGRRHLIQHMMQPNVGRMRE